VSVLQEKGHKGWSVPVGYAENFHSVTWGGHLYLVCAVCDVTIDVIFMFPN